MKIAIVPASMMTQQLELWRLEREVDEFGRKIERIEHQARATRRAYKRKCEELFSAEDRIVTARANIDRILRRG